MKKLIWVLIIFSLLFFSRNINAQQQFISNSTVTYDIAGSGTTTVSHDISLQNATSDYYATSYTLSLTGINPINPKAYEGSVSLPVEVKTDNGATSLKVTFSEAVVGQGSKREFSIVFQDKTLVTKTGEIWEIITPKLADANSFNFYSTIIKVPNSFGKLAYVAPAPSFQSEEKGKTVFSFDKNASIKNAITAAFGQFQVFSFNLTYHLENPLNQRVSTDIAIPPDTNYQKVSYSQIEPAPKRVWIDSDGNWLATYELKARERVDVKVKGAVQLFADPLGVPKTDSKSLAVDLQSTELWQTTDAKITNLAKQLKTPRAIYNYVTTTLSYDYLKVQPNVSRLGALDALKNPKNAICTEFTDLFIAIARAAGIPAREIEGYAYTDNPQIQPLSLVADVLHAWPEYWDSSKNVWVAVDPTWGSTSGIDYFTKLDLKHFAFVVHGQDPKKPYPAGSYKLGANPQKDVEVSFGQLTTNRAVNLQVENTVLSQIPFSDEIIGTTIKNMGSVAAYNLTFQALFDDKPGLPDSAGKKIDVIPPYGEYKINIDIPYSFLGRTTPAKVKMLIDNTPKSEFLTYKIFVTISNLLMVSLFIFLAVFLVYLRFRDAKKRNPSSGTSA